MLRALRSQLTLCEVVLTLVHMVVVEEKVKMRGHYVR